MTPRSLALFCVTLVEAAREAVDDLAPSRLVEQALPPRPPKRSRVLVVASGKAAAAMALGALARWPDIAGGVVVTTDALAPDAREKLPAHIDVHGAPRPIPDERSAAAAEACLSAASLLRRTDLLLGLVSGGSSALLALPRRGLTLRVKSEVVRRLLSEGAPIRDVNTVRRHL